LEQGFLLNTLWLLAAVAAVSRMGLAAAVGLVVLIQAQASLRF
jgi:hypothetical protein